MMSDAEIWRRSRDMSVPEDDGAERFLALAVIADGHYDEDEHALVAEWFASDPTLADDVAFAQAATAIPASAAVLARAAALVPEQQPNNVVAFQPRQRAMRAIGEWTGWGSLVAAMAVASWLGFTLGVDTTRSLTSVGQSSDDGFLREMVDPSPGFMRDLSESEGNQT
jgi:hypothetical protein